MKPKCCNEDYYLLPKDTVILVKKTTVQLTLILLIMYRV